MQKWSIYDPETFIIYEVIFSDVQPPNSTPVMVTELMAKPKFDPQTNTISESGTPEEVEEFLAKFKPLEMQNLWIDAGDGTFRRVETTNGVITVSDPIE